MISEVHHDEDHSRYTLWLEGEAVGLADYTRRGTDVVFLHTEIAPEHRHEGLGQRLIEAALDDAHQRGAQVVPLCPFVAQFISEHPDYQEMVAR
ncbi:GNAT family N-acetyltransferase [Rathayibacter toxicus]|uniref:Acetyltransferase n=1 Tax=Rathayibacter toxicus TaxID=145458 RepID=A0A0C5BG01_9MICO|nr:GNAT family N-acetyltransferase [Rathayibacter toxicus]AJM77120.1 acetyltransferase [Rathayibacter toxicus]ALS57047.1 acetyltransferase [Rathayibacter toxicus]KKM46128.1 acetyltransferase [Rathayibacter toxicus]PPG23078.1 N-acetyltransferase [Rathayibacter toxicus]PPG47661.1 N-acetyltransferase [Rathayibacter toxicus]